MFMHPSLFVSIQTNVQKKLNASNLFLIEIVSKRIEKDKCNTFYFRKHKTIQKYDSYNNVIE